MCVRPFSTIIMTYPKLGTLKKGGLCSSLSGRLIAQGQAVHGFGFFLGPLIHNIVCVSLGRNACGRKPLHS